MVCIVFLESVSVTVKLHLKLTRELHLKLTRLFSQL
jgi:hypothetical protein